MIHLNGNLLCIVDTETTGLTPGKHDIWQLGILPLGFDLEPHKRHLPLEITMVPRRPENIDYDGIPVGKLKMAQVINSGLDWSNAAELFDEWFERLKLGVNKKIMPLAHNWLFDRDFLIDWLGREHFSHYFDYHYRDLMPTALYINDKKDYFNEQVAFPKYYLRYLYQELGLDPNDIQWHDAMGDCVATARIYKKMIQMQML